MKLLRIIVNGLLVIVLALFVFSEYSRRVSTKNDGPELSCPEEPLEISVSDDRSVLLKGVTAADRQDGDLTDEVLLAGVSKLITEDTARVSYLVFDSDNNMASATRAVRYLDYRRPRFQVPEPLQFATADTVELTGSIRAADVIDGDISDAVRVSSLQSTEAEDVFSITVQVTNSMGDTAIEKLPVIIGGADRSDPKVILKHQLIYLEQGASFEPRQYLSGVKLPSGRASLSDVEIDSPVNTQEPGSYWVAYRYSSEAGDGMSILTVIVE